MLTIGEVVRFRVDDLTWVEYLPDALDGDGVKGWLLSVIGKGDKLRDVPVPDEVIKDLRIYLEHRGLQPHPPHPLNQGAYLIAMTSYLKEHRNRRTGFFN